VSDEKRTTEPHDRLTRLCDVMTTAMEADPEHGPDVKCIVFLDDGKRGGLQLHNYEDDTDAMVDLLMHLRAIFRSNGKELLIAPLNEG
jgi:hypothetical protein